MFKIYNKKTFPQNPEMVKNDKFYKINRNVIFLLLNRFKIIFIRILKACY